MKLKTFAVLFSIVLAACQSNESKTSTAASASSGSMTINGAGATFPNPIYSKWFDEYQKAHPGIRINYQPIGSGGGIKQLTAQTVFFGATDGPMTDAQLQAAPGAILHFPTVLGGVVPVYNVTGVTQPLRFSGAVLADIYLGKITKWNDPAIAAINPGVKLPADDINVVHRSEGSGTTYIFCDFLSKVSLDYKQKVGVSTAVNWPVGVGAKGNEGVSGLVRQTPGAIGYVELIYALQNKMSYGSVQNKARQFVTASLDSVTAAAAGAAMPDDFRVSITNADGATAYPIASFTWLLLYQHPKDAARGKAMVDFLKWALTDGQKFAPSLGYAPLPQPVVDKETAALAKVSV
ncbi:MAG: phosphate ABC transporter substrate-binding protein PstS [Acidobacteria bacterium]|nr:phosphate ABC transporter substrate-binding protein PstS [Acidobacteriota bacterium]MBV9186298.1 phosphate ABC transporter substrate-binding protein PstS [Acidobacteriota bacterium]